ncbi:hypothetical protein ACF082_29245 [Streptomyces lydicus]|uniref:hypothetical protein n=1 Tax=Streptomyces lydicus TaxID=47763 RepID=UPI0036FF38FE
MSGRDVDGPLEACHADAHAGLPDGGQLQPPVQVTEDPLTGFRLGRQLGRHHLLGAAPNGDGELLRAVLRESGRPLRERRVEAFPYLGPLARHLGRLGEVPVVRPVQLPLRLLPVTLLLR